MSRRRYVSTEISVDKQVNRMGMKHGDAPVLLYTWMIPHAADDGTVTGDPFELLNTVWPGRRDKTEDDVIACLEAMEEFGLIEWDQDAALVLFPADSFYKYQTYIKPDNRRKAMPTVARHRTSAQNSGEQRKTPENTASLSPSPSVSPSPSLPPSENKTPVRPAAPTAADYSPEFDAFWALFPRKIDKQAAYKAWLARLKGGAPVADLIAAAEHYAAFHAETGTETAFLKHAKTFLGPSRPYEEWVHGPPEVSQQRASPTQGRPTVADQNADLLRRLWRRNHPEEVHA